MATFVQWVHVASAVVGVGGIGFMILILIPAIRVLASEQRDLLLKSVQNKFRWVSWAVIVLLLTSGLYNTSRVWEVPPGTYWRFLKIKIALALVVFAISLGLTLPLKVLERIRARRKGWLIIAFTLGMVVILISAYLRHF